MFFWNTNNNMYLIVQLFNIIVLIVPETIDCDRQTDII